MTDAVAAALPIEIKKHAYRQTQDGIVISFVMHPNDVSPALATAPLGTRYVAALVEVGDDEQPVEREQIAPPRKDRAWPDLSPAKQAGIRCREPAFWRFLGTRYAVAPGSVNNAEVAADVIRNVLGVTSRKDIIPGSAAADQWRKIDADYQFWMQNP